MLECATPQPASSATLQDSSNIDSERRVTTREQGYKSTRPVHCAETPVTNNLVYYRSRVLYLDLDMPAQVGARGVSLCTMPYPLDCLALATGRVLGGGGGIYSYVRGYASG